jgi:RNA polymerase sigma-70 factor (ECF subfamily)
MLAPTTTHVSLLARLSDMADEAAWREFSERYGEMISTVGRRWGLQPADCDDLVQEVLLALSKAMQGFEYRPEKGKFRAYLKTITLHAVGRILRQKGLTARRGDTETASNAAGHSAPNDHAWDEEWRANHVRRAMQVIEVEFSGAQLRAFQRHAVDGSEAQAVAEALKLTVNQVYQAKSRILKRLTELVQEQVDDEG